MKSELIRLQSVHAAQHNSMLRGADFKLYKGEAVGLVGGFHSGKMLLMEIIAGTFVPSRGYRFIHGKPVSFGCPVMDLRVKHLKKNFGLVGPMTVWENIASHRRQGSWLSKCLVPEGMRPQVQEMLASYGIEGDSGILANRLSSIQKFAVALLKARLEEVELILVESSELEYSVSGFRMMQQLLKLCRDQGMSVLFSGIDAGGFSPLLDRVCLIDAGRIIWEEQVQESRLQETAASCGAMSVRLNIPVKRSPFFGSEKRPVQVCGDRFSITGGRGEFLMLLDPEQALPGIFPDPAIRAFFLTGEGRRKKPCKARIRQIDFSSFDRLVKWMSPADNLIFGLSSKFGSLGVIKPHLKQYMLQEFAQWTGEERYLEMRDCESLVIGERIKIAAFRLKLDKPDVVMFRHFQLLDQDSRAIVLPILEDLLREGTVLIGISTLDHFSDFADGYVLIAGGRCGGRMDYGQIRAALAQNEGDENERK